MTDWQKQVKSALTNGECYPDKIVCHKDGRVSAKRGYFYHHGWTSEKWADVVVSTLVDVPHRVCEHRDDYRQWPTDSYLVVVLAEPHQRS